jgi:hypothetical protein
MLGGLLLLLPVGREVCLQVCLELRQPLPLCLDHSSTLQQLLLQQVPLTMPRPQLRGLLVGLPQHSGPQLRVCK